MGSADMGINQMIRIVPFRGVTDEAILGSREFLLSVQEDGTSIVKM